MNIKIALIAILLTCSVFIDTFGQAEINYAGLYQTLVGQDTSYYLRFLPDGEVIGVLSSSNSVESIRKWFHYENRSHHDNGFFILERRNIKIVLTYKGTDTVLLYEGFIDDNSDLVLKCNYFEDGEVKSTTPRFWLTRFK